MAAETLLLDVAETFYSIQGESSFSGYPCVFIRLAGCNLRCRWCDSRYTYEQPGRLLAISEILDYVDQHPGALVEITGGEPLLQENVYPLLSELIDLGRTVLLETNGSISLKRVPATIIKIVDLKCPDSGMHEQMDFDNLRYLTPSDEIKFVISSERDYDWAVTLLRSHEILQFAAVIFSPVITKISPAALARKILADGLPVRLQVQLHAILWPDRERGV